VRRTSELNRHSSGGPERNPLPEPAGARHASAVHLGASRSGPILLITGGSAVRSC
jgi:hypothetical protein